MDIRERKKKPKLREVLNLYKKNNDLNDPVA